MKSGQYHAVDFAGAFATRAEIGMPGFGRPKSNLHRVNTFGHALYLTASACAH